MKLWAGKDFFFESIDFSHYHACPSCYRKLGDDDVLSGRLVGEIRQQNVDKCEAILEEMNLKVFWEHE